MKKLSLAIIFTLFSSLCFAQNFDYFASAGIAGSQIDGDHLGGYNKFGFTLGMGVSYDFTNRWSGQMELNFIQKGKGSAEGTSDNNYKTRLNYAEVPLLAQYHLTDYLSIETGISFAYLVSYHFYENGENNDEHRPYTPYSYDMDWLLGATYTINEHWKANLRFAYSIVPIGDTIDDDVYTSHFGDNLGAKYNRTLCLSLQYWF